MDAITLADSVSIASGEPGHPLNPQFCMNCHTEYLDICKGWICGKKRGGCGMEYDIDDPLIMDQDGPPPPTGPAAAGTAPAPAL